MGRYMVFEEVDLGGSESVCRTVLLVDQSSPDFFLQRGKNCGRYISIPIFGISIRSRDIRHRILKLSEADPTFAHFWPRPLWGRASKILGPRL